MTWFCINHNGITNLDVHGRCEVCQSDAVDIAVRSPSAEALEKLLDIENKMSHSRSSRSTRGYYGHR